MTRTWLVLAALLAVAIVAPAGAQEKKPPKVTYVDDVLPILRQKCFSCHDADEKNGDLDLTNYTNLMLGGGSGEVVVPGDSGGSYLYKLIAHQSEPYMPPEQPKLPDAMIETIRKWIDGGVLETKASTARIKKKNTVKFALKDAPTERPQVPPMPPRLSLEPIVHTSTTTAVSALATSPWSPLAAVAGQGQVLLYNTKTLELEGTLPFPEGVPQVLKFSRNGSLLLAGGGRSGAAGKAIVWNVQTGERVFEVGDELDTVLAADISSDQTLVALGGPRRVVRIYSTESGQLLHELRKHTDWIYNVEFSPDSVLLATGDRNGGLMVWEGWTGREYLTLKGHSKGITGISWRADSNIVASGSEDGSIKLWEMNNGSAVKSWGAHGGGVASLEMARDGRVLSCGRDKVAKLWDANGGAIRSFEAFGDLAVRVTFCDETNRAIAGDWTGAVRIWEAADGKRVGDLTPNPPKLSSRLEAAQQQLTAKTAEHKPLAAGYVAAQTAADKAKADLAAAQKAATEAKQKLDAATAKLTAAQQALTKATAENAAAAKAVAALAPGVPVLQQALAKAQEAAGKLPGDKEVADLVAKLKTLADQRTAQLAASQKAATEKAAALAAAKAATDAADKVAKASDAAYKAAQANVAKLTPLVKPAEEAAAAAKLKADQAAAALAAAQGAVKRWTDEIAFAKQLGDLTLQRTNAFKAVEEKAVAHAELAEAADLAGAALNEANAKVKTANDAVVSGQQAAVAAKAESDKAQQATAAAEAARVAAVTGASELEALIPLLGEAAAKTKAAADKAKDPELTAAAAKLQAIADGKKKALETAKADVAAKTKAVEAAKQVGTAAAAKLTQATAGVTAAQKRAADLATAAKPLEAKMAAAKKAAADAQTLVDTAEKAVTQISEQIAKLKGIAA